MTVHERVYRGLVHLYPKSFRSHYGDDLSQHFTDLIGRDGVHAARDHGLHDIRLPNFLGKGA